MRRSEFQLLGIDLCWLLSIDSSVMYRVPMGKESLRLVDDTVGVAE